MGAQTPIAGHIRAIRPLLLVGRDRLAVKVERHPRVIPRPTVRPKAKRLLRTSQDNTGRRPRLTLDRRTGLLEPPMAIVLVVAPGHVGPLCRLAGGACHISQSLPRTNLSCHIRHAQLRDPGALLSASLSLLLSGSSRTPRDQSCVPRLVSRQGRNGKSGPEFGV